MRNDYSLMLAERSASRDNAYAASVVTRFVEMSAADEPVDVGFTVVPSKKLRPNPNVRGMGKVLS